MSKAASELAGLTGLGEDQCRMAIRAAYVQNQQPSRSQQQHLPSRSSRLARLGWMAASLVITQTEPCQRR